MASSPPPPPPPPPPSPLLKSRPRMTAYRCILRLRDRLEFFLGRFVDGDLTAPKEFRVYKANRDRRWAEKDAKQKGVSASAVAGSIINSPANMVPARNHVDVLRDLGVPVPGNKGKAKETALYPGDEVEAGQTSQGTQGTTERQQMRAPRLRDISRSSPLSSFVGSTLGKRRRHRRKRSDARPGYFDPNPFSQEARPGANMMVAEGDEDRLEMNIPAMLARRSWTVPIGTAR